MDIEIYLIQENVSQRRLKTQIVIALMGLPPSLKRAITILLNFIIKKRNIKADIPFDSLAFKDASETFLSIVYESIKSARKLLPGGTIFNFILMIPRGWVYLVTWQLLKPVQT